MAQRRFSRVITATRHRSSSIDNGIYDHNFNQVEEIRTSGDGCCPGGLWDKWTYVILVLVLIHVVTLTTIGIFFWEQQREINRHDELIMKLHQSYKQTRNIQRLRNDLKVIAKRNAERSGQQDSRGNAALFSEMAEEIRTLKRESDEIHERLKKQKDEIYSIKRKNIAAVEDIIQHNFTLELDNFEEKVA